MLTKLKLTNGAFIAMDRAYIDYKVFQGFTDNGVFLCNQNEEESTLYFS
jgi:hypothetical protein